MSTSPTYGDSALDGTVPSLEPVVRRFQDLAQRDRLTSNDTTHVVPGEESQPLTGIENLKRFYSNNGDGSTTTPEVANVGVVVAEQQQTHAADLSTATANVGVMGSNENHDPAEPPDIEMRDSVGDDAVVPEIVGSLALALESDPNLALALEIHHNLALALARNRALSRENREMLETIRGLTSPEEFERIRATVESVGPLYDPEGNDNQ